MQHGTVITNVFKLLIEAGADVNLRHKDGRTALMMAAGEGHNKCVEQLIQAGADVNHTGQ